jgi:hypothetical protein
MRWWKYARWALKGKVNEMGIETPTRSRTISGVVKNGVVILENGISLPEGARVEVRLRNGAAHPAASEVEPLEFTPEERAEFEMWDRAGDEDLAAFEASLDREECEDAAR